MINICIFLNSELRQPYSPGFDIQREKKKIKPFENKKKTICPIICHQSWVEIKLHKTTCLTKKKYIKYFRGQLFRLHISGSIWKEIESNGTKNTTMIR